MKSALALAVFPYFLLTVSWMRWAQAEPQKPKPGPQYQRLHYFVGDCQIEWGNIARPHDGPGSKVTVTDHSEMLGDFFVVSHREGRRPGGKEIGILRYDPEQKVYTYEGFGDDGDVARATGTISGDTWVLLAPAINPCRQGGDKVKERFTLKEVSPRSYTFTSCA
jgi:hypothetical protein